MRRKLLKFVSVLSLAALLVAFVPLPAQRVRADSVDELRQELDKLKQESVQIQQQLDKLGDSISDQQIEVAQLKKKVTNLEKQIETCEAQIAALNKQIEGQEAQIATLNTEIADKEAEMKAIVDKLKQRVHAISKSSNYSSLQLLMDTDNYTDYLLKSKILEAVSKYDQGLRDQAAAEKKGIQERHDAVEREKVAAKAAAAEVETLKKGLDSQYATLESLYTTAKNKETNLLKQQGNYEAKLKKIREAEDELDREIEKMLNGGLSTEKYGGKMYWPAPGITRISSGYGQRSSGFHYAIDISNGRSLGYPIIAAASGTVVKATYHYSYGNFVMIDHGVDEQGRQIMTLYAHMRYAPSVSVGQRVVGGVTQLGQIGNTGESYGAHLHFEVRVNNKRVDPIGNGYVVKPS